MPSKWLYHYMPGDTVLSPEISQRGAAQACKWKAYKSSKIAFNLYVVHSC